MISVLTPALNQGKYIRRNIESVLQQGVPLEHIVVDGGSRDGTIDILREYKHLKWSSRKDRGQSDALLKAYARSAGRIVCWLNADDYLEPGALATVRELIDSAKVDVVMGGVRFVDVDERPLREFPGVALSAIGLLNYEECVLQPGTFVTRRCIEEVGFVDPRYHYVMDHEWLYRVCKRYSPVAISAILANFRIHSESKTGSRKGRFLMEMLRFKARNGGRFTLRRDGRAVLRIAYDEVVGRIVDRCPE
jgi:glycosyltransferase involved in cell wall biosynthesis